MHPGILAALSSDMLEKSAGTPKRLRFTIISKPTSIPKLERGILTPHRVAKWHSKIARRQIIVGQNRIIYRGHRPAWLHV
jgi:hypothetical protein